MKRIARHYWHVAENGYHRELWYVETGTDRIAGTVTGSPYESRGTWRAARRDPNKTSQLGDFRKEAAAKLAVESSIAEDAQTREKGE